MTIWNMEITASESPQTVHIPLEGKYYAIKNTGESDILVSSYVANPAEGADDVMKIPSGSAAVIPVKDGDLYVSAEEDSTYSVSIQDDKVIPWSGGTGSGGESGDNTHYKGTTTTALENGSTTNPIVIDGESYTAVFGDVVVYGYTEFVFDGTAWSEFGRPFDTTPKDGSTNAVTSGGIYSLIHKGTGTNSVILNQGNTSSNVHAVAGGYHTSASGQQSTAFGNEANASGNRSFAAGYYTTANQSNMTALGAYNSPNAGDLFNIGNGDSNARSNIVEVNATEMNVNGDIQQNGVPLRATTMPTITASMLGKVVQYVGTSDSNYKQGWNYVAVSDGAEPPTYSWQALMDTTPTSGSTNAVASDGIYAALSGKQDALTFDNYPTSGSNNPVTSNGLYNIAHKGSGSRAVVLGSESAYAGGDYGIASGYRCYARAKYSVCGGADSNVSAGAMYGIAFGYNCISTANYGIAIGSGINADQANLTAFGKYNSSRTGDLFNIGNGDSNARSNIVEVNATEMNVNGDIGINNIAIPIPYTTMPTITADMLGKIAMYVGATGNGYTQGCFYIAATDGAAEPTYSWVKIGSNYREVELYSNDEHSATPIDTVITLSQDWTGFDAIGFVSEYNGQTGLCAYNEYKVSVISALSRITLNFDVGSTENSFIFLTKNTSNSFVVDGMTSSASARSHVYKIIGIKY